MGKRRRTGAGNGFYGTTVKNLDEAGFLKELKDPRDLAQLIVKAFIESPQFIETHANEAAALAAGLKTGTIYKTATGELRIKL